MKKNFWKKAATLLMAIGLTSLGLTGCGSSGQSDTGSNSAGKEADSSSNTSGEELKTLRIGFAGTEDASILYNAVYAVKNGYFEEELKEVGYKPEITYFAGAGPEMNEAFAADALDAAVVGDLPAFTAKSNGIDNKIIAVAHSKMQYAVLVANDKIKEPKDLEGKKVIVASGTVTDFFWRHYAEANGIDTSKVEIINAQSDANSLLQTGEADAYVAARYILELAASMGIGTIMETGVDTTDAYTTFIVEIAQKILDDNDEVATAIDKALIRSYDDIIANQDAFYAAIESEYFTQDIWKADFSFDPTLAFLSPEITEEAVSYYKELNDWLLENAIITESVDVDSFVDTSYYQKAANALGKQ